MRRKEGEVCGAGLAGERVRLQNVLSPGTYSPVLRSLSRLRPTMSLEEGLSRAMQEWQRTSSFDRRKYYDMAAK